MSSPVLIITTVASLLGIILNGTVLYLVLSRGRKKHHILFAGVLLACAIWDLGIFLAMVRNDFLNEVLIYGYIASLPASFIAALAFHFTNEFIRRPATRQITAVWGLTALSYAGIITGVWGRVDGLYHYSWGNIFRIDPGPAFMPPLMILFWLGTLAACGWLLSRDYRKRPTPLERRHNLYILAGFTAIGLASVKIAVVQGIDLPLVLPLGMILNDTFAALIGLAIVKDRLFDITIILKKSALYSMLAALILFLFSLSEHVLASFVAETFGGHSQLLHLVSIALVIAVLIPVKHRLEHVVERFFAQKKLEF